MRKNIQRLPFLDNRFQHAALNIGGILKTYSQISNLKGKKKRRKNISHKIVSTLVTTRGQLLQHMSTPK
jgi:hypothetical protein